MRLGEIKKNLNEVLNDEKKILINHETIYGGQAHLVKNFVEIMAVLDIVFEQKWNKIDNSKINNIKIKYESYQNPVQMSQDEYNQINSYITTLNNQIPLFFGILETMTDDQDEQTINIKLPDTKINSLDKLSKLNNRIDKIFKEFNVDGEFEFRGFDKGTSWYQLCVIGFLTYNFFISCLKIAQEFFKTKKEYYNSEEAKIDYQASLEKKDNFSEKGLEDYTKRRLDLILENNIKKIIEELKYKNGHSEAELQTKLVIATKDLIKEIEEGVEFHLSLNPPKYAEVIGGELKIDYVKIRELKKDESEIKTLEAPKGNDTKDTVNSLNNNKQEPTS